MINSFFTKEQYWLDRWDNYLQNNERGIYLQLSDWIKSYEVYGFDYDFYIITQNDEIVGGCGVVIAKVAFFKFLILSCGPILSEGFENQMDETILNLKKYAKEKNCICFQMNIPSLHPTNSFSNYFINEPAQDSVFFSGKEGTKFKYVIPLLGVRLVDLQHKTMQDVVQKFSSNHKRNHKKTISTDFEFRYVNSLNEVAEAYQCFELNAKQKGYPIRAFESMQNTLMNYIEKDYARIGCCFYQNKIVGAIYVLRCGKRFSYINGGILKQHQDLPISIYLHSKIIEDSISNEYQSYDLCVGGTDGVVRFKEGFGSELYTFYGSRYWVLKPIYFKVYLFLEKHLKSHKQAIAKVLFQVKKRLK